MSATKASETTPSPQANPYEPHIAVIEKVIDEAPNVRTFHFNFKDPAVAERFTFESGQFAEFSVFGVGEAPFCISSSPTRPDHLEFAVQRVGKVTNALHRLGPGSEIGFRGPYGNSFPFDLFLKKNLVFVAGGIGLAPLRSLIWNVVDNRDNYGDIHIVYGARNPDLLCFTYDLEAWANEGSVGVITTIDKEDPRWTGRVGLVPHVLEEAGPSPENSVAVVCGPPIMIRFTLPVLEKLSFQPDQIVTTLEKKMKCGIGKCGRCNIGNLYVCRDGPVFTLAQIRDFISGEH